jgi:hypothetical protein
MKKNLLIMFFFFHISGVLYGQDKENCGCPLVLKEIITDIESKYPGFQHKTDKAAASYRKTKMQAIAEAAKVPDREECFYVIEKYISFFKDNHIIFTDRISEPKQLVFESKNENPVTIGDSLSGTWVRAGSPLTVKIIKMRSKGQLIHRAYLLDSISEAFKKGHIYFDLIGNSKEFKIRKYNSALTTDLLRGRRLRNLLIEPNGIWKKITSSNSGDSVLESKYAANNKFVYQAIANHVYYIGIPSFNTDPKRFDSLVLQKMIPEMTAGKIKNLIIDLRNNVGGNSSFLSLLRIIYEKPILLPGDFVFSTPDIIDRYRESSNLVHQKMLPKLIKEPNKFVQRDSLKLSLKEIYSWPEKVSIIVNENCASSTEYFLILAKHSSKVKIYGRHTAGTLDYSELLGPEQLSCKGYSYMRPTTKSFWTDTKPIDNKGIQPDIDLTPYPDSEWVEIVKNQN